MAFVATNWKEESLVLSRNNSSVTIQEWMYHNFEAFISSITFCSIHLFDYLCDTDSGGQTNNRAQNCNQRLLRPLITALVRVLHQLNYYLQTFFAVLWMIISWA